MTGFNHVLTGVTIAVAVQQPVLAPLLALASHFVLDMLPHFGGVHWFDTWGKKLITLTIFDTLLCISFVVLGILFFPAHWPLILLCALLAILPDLLWVFHYKYGVKHRFFVFHQAIQRYERPWGAYVEIVFCLLLLSLLWLIA